MTVGAVVLAAGAATRFGTPKQRLILPHVLDALSRAGLERVVVVSGAYDLHLPAGHDAGVSVRACADWERGPGASLRCGLDELGDGLDAAVVVLADGPDLSPEAVTRVVSAWRAGAGDVVAASYGGRRGHPLVLGRRAWDGVPDDGLRGRDAALVPCDDLGDPGDVDAPGDLPARLRGEAPL